MQHTFHQQNLGTFNSPLGNGLGVPQEFSDGAFNGRMQFSSTTANDASSAALNHIDQPFSGSENLANLVSPNSTSSAQTCPQPQQDLNGQPHGYGGSSYNNHHQVQYSSQYPSHLAAASGDFSNYGPMYSTYSSYIKCRTNPYQRPSMSTSTSGSGENDGHLAAAHAAAAAAMYYPGLAAQTDCPTEGSTAATLAAALYHQRNGSYEYPGAGRDNHIFGKMSEVPQSMD